MKNFLIFIVALAFTLLNDSVLAQNICSQNLKQAQRKYDQGLLEDIEPLLNECLNAGFTKPEKALAYKLLCLKSIFEDDRVGSEENLLKLLKIDPEYQPNLLLDPSEFINLFNTYRTSSVYDVGIRVGANFSFVHVLVPYGINNTTQNVKEYKSNVGFQAGVSANRLIYKGLVAGADLVYTQRNFEVGYRQFGYSEGFFVERESWFDIPVVLKYGFGKSRFVPYVQAGGYAGFLLSSEILTPERKDLASGSNLAIGPNIELNVNDDLRNKFNYGLIAGAGFIYKIGLGFVFLDLRYAYGLALVNNPEARYSNDELTFKYSHIDDDFRLNNIFISTGYMYSFYKAKKLKKYVRK